MTEKKHDNKIPKISPDRVDTSPANTSVGSTKEDQLAHAFVKGKEPVHRQTIRMPQTMYDDLSEIAFKNGRMKITHIILKLVRDYIKENKKQP